MNPTNLNSTLEYDNMHNNMDIALIEIIGVDIFYCKSSSDRLKIQTATPESYRSLVHFLKEQDSQNHTYQLKEDKPTRVVIRNIHPPTSLELIKSELELRLFENTVIRDHTVDTLLIVYAVETHILPQTAPNQEIVLPNAPYAQATGDYSSTTEDATSTEKFHVEISQTIKSTNNNSNVKESHSLLENNHPSTLPPTSSQRTYAHATSNQSRDSNHPPPVLDFDKKMSSYTLFKSNHLKKTAHSGVDIIIKSTLSFSLLPNFSLDYLQSCTVSINLGLSAHFNVLYNFVNAKKYSILAPPSPTYWPTSPLKKPDILDIFISKVPSNLYCNQENILDLNSGTSSVLLTINVSPTICMTPPKLFYPSTDRIKFHILVDQEITLNVKLKTHEDIDNGVDKFTSIIQTAAWASQSKPTPTSTKFLLLPIHLRSLITDKRRARAGYQSSRLPSHKAMYNLLSNFLKKHLLKHKLDIFQQNLSNLSSSDGSLWRETNKLLKYKSSLPPLTKTDNSIAITDENKAETYRQHLSEIFKPHPDINNPDLTSKVTQYIDCPMPLHFPEKCFTPNKLKTAIQKYSIKKTPGFDLITAVVARCLPKKSILFLTYLFNAILRLSYFSLLWKFSNIVMIPKRDKPPDLTSSYRPISLLPFLVIVISKSGLDPQYPKLRKS
ncbi:Uncharacterized protein FWK35_00014980 [Aphis craccivora]|uniref:Reverse transcriptase domain-containing protein n=1 Tax=Aphis craccivora TaxID=307492 RepID=A0A6G0Y804_APHCR|nr:Uncharacterized protein FWK35_00014980 [Aphis craccivora]